MILRVVLLLVVSLSFLFACSRVKPIDSPPQVEEAPGSSIDNEQALYQKWAAEKARKEMIQKMEEEENK